MINFTKLKGCNQKEFKDTISNNEQMHKRQEYLLLFIYFEF